MSCPDLIHVASVPYSQKAEHLLYSNSCLLVLKSESEQFTPKI